MRVLCLAHRWGFEDIRALAIDRLADFVSGLSGIRKVELGKQFHVVDWTLSGLVAIVLAQDLEFDRLVKHPYYFDYEEAGKILSLRSQAALRAAQAWSNRCKRCADGSYTFIEWERAFSLSYSCPRRQRIL
ncbi:hypothetical protein D9619_002112 [Psilocybe cf. subviscida]|uniref:Uncharacterized protein n=1 Tax=Psilocybe cf. subviscida TaxID=2480587 RepID=A0A8H5F1Y5_9AGAR|nr:hypothetical protein D9619_002112 [Psilocybe cf. subviscida]